MLCFTFPILCFPTRQYVSQRLIPSVFLFECPEEIPDLTGFRRIWAFTCPVFELSSFYISLIKMSTYFLCFKNFQLFSTSLSLVFYAFFWLLLHISVFQIYFVSFKEYKAEFCLRNSRLRRSHRDIYLVRRNAHPARRAFLSYRRTFI
ncbi:putative membrane lipoprotein [Clostridium sp. D5]|nr:putative membrane lipoprotein [Clostridium sp. D5]